MRNIIYFTLLVVIIWGCKNNITKNHEPVQDNKKTPVFELVPETYSTVQFKNKIEENLYFNFFNYSYIYNGGGVAV